VTIEETIANPCPILTQAERDEIDNAAVKDAWISLAGVLPVSTGQRIARGEVFYSALELAEYLIGAHKLAGWRINFTTDGGPYSAVLLLNGSPETEPEVEIAAIHPTSLALAFISVIRKWSGRTRSSDR
jgi:hypothetical protein